MADDSGNEALTEDTRPTAKIMERDVRAVCTCGYQSPPVPEWLALRAARCHEMDHAREALRPWGGRTTQRHSVALVAEPATSARRGR
jgi:hypothetical protein